MCSFKDTVIISIEYSQPSILSMVLYNVLTLKFAVIQFIFIKVLENGLNQLITYVIPKLTNVWHVDNE